MRMTSCSKRILLSLCLLAATGHCLAVRLLAPNEPGASLPEASSLIARDPNEDDPDVEGSTGNSAPTVNSAASVACTNDGEDPPNATANAIATAAEASASGAGSALYIVRLHSALPLAAYRGAPASFSGWADDDDDGSAADAAGLKATAEAVNEEETALGGRLPHRARLSADNPQIAAYAQMLESQQVQVASEVGVASTSVAYSYKYTSNGFAAVLTAAQLRRVKRHPAVASVRPSARKHLFTTDSPAFLGMTSAGSLWPANGGQSKAGEGMVIGIVDTGIWPEHPSFSDAGFPASRPAGWSGKCDTTKEFKCNNKVIGARAFYQAFKNANRMDLAGDWLSPRDADGHGTWCAGAAAGNSGVSMAGGKASGMAPAARLAMYKIFWTSGGSMFAEEADIIAAVNQAVADGVDVISLSLGGVNPEDTYFDDIAYLNANLAGVVVTYAAGNSGPPSGGYRTLDNYAPFYLTVGASSIARGGLSLASPPKANAEAAPQVTDFSSTGPLVFPDVGSGNGLATDSILKPDIIGPGLDVYAAAPGEKVGQKGGSAQLSGTSMATPHLAGIAALIMQKYPKWSPAQVMSAIITTAKTTDTTGKPIKNSMGGNASPWDMGGGHVFPPKVLDPGLTYDARKSAYLNFLAGLDMQRTRDEYPNEKLIGVSPRELNRPTIAIGNLRGKLMVTRTVTSVSDSKSTYSYQLEAPKGVSVTVAPKTFTISPGEKVSYVVTFKVTKASNEFQYGSLTWVDDKGHSVRSAIAVKPTRK